MVNKTTRKFTSYVIFYCVQLHNTSKPPTYETKKFLEINEKHEKIFWKHQEVIYSFETNLFCFMAAQLSSFHF